VHCLRAFLAVPRVEAVYVAVRRTEIERVAALVAEFGLGTPGAGSKVHVVEGGDHSLRVSKKLPQEPVDEAILNAVRKFLNAK